MYNNNNNNFLLSSVISYFTPLHYKWEWYFFLFFLLPAKGSRRVEDTQQIIQEVQPCKPARRQSADLLIHFYRTEIKAHTAEQMRAERQRHTGRERRRTREMELIYNSFMIFLLRKKNFQAQPPEAALECLFVFERSSTRAQTLWSDQTPKCLHRGPWNRVW